jgi:hypothetical protein
MVLAPQNVFITRRAMEEGSSEETGRMNYVIARHELLVLLRYVT